MAFATADDVAARLGRDLTDAEGNTAELVVEVVTGLIVTAVGRDDAWATALTPVPADLRLLCIEKAVGAIVNPENVASESETLGAYQHSRTLPRASDIGIFLSDEEGRRVRFAIFGQNSASPRVGAIIDAFYPC